MVLQRFRIPLMGGDARANVSMVPYIFQVGVRGFVGGTKYFGRVPWPVT